MGERESPLPQGEREHCPLPVLLPRTLPLPTTGPLVFPTPETQTLASQHSSVSARMASSPPGALIHRCKAPPRKLQTPSPTPGQPYSVAVARRNERERKRVHLVNMGFASLRSHLPDWPVASKKLSKVETLRSAVEYITRLQEVLGDAALENLRPSTESTPEPGLSPSPDSSSMSGGGHCSSRAGEVLLQSLEAARVSGEEENHFLELAQWFGYAS
ncbi:unnamed protein product [Ixodes persulcatus]